MQRYGKPYKLFHCDGTYDDMCDGGQGDSLATSALTAIHLKVGPIIFERCKKVQNNWQLLITGRS